MDKVRAAKLRRMAGRRGLRLVKSRRKDPGALDYGLFALIDPEHGGTIHPMFEAVNSPYALTIDEVEEWLTDDSAAG